MFGKKEKEKKKKEKKYGAFNPKERKFFVSSLAVVCFLVLFAGVGMASATDYYVATGGSDSNTGTSLGQPWQHPSYAAQQAQAGDTIYVLEGTWKNEHVVFAHSGTASNPIVMKAYDSSKKWTLDGVDYTGTGIRIRDKSHIFVSDFRVLNFCNGLDGKYDTDITVSDFYIESTESLQTQGIEFRYSDRIYVQHGEIRDIWQGVHFMRDVSDSVMDHVSVYDSSDHGLWIHDDTQGTYPCYNNRIRNCYVKNTNHNGIDLHSGVYNTLIENCDLTGDMSMLVGIYFHGGKGSGLTVKDCVIHGYGNAIDPDHGLKALMLHRPDVTIINTTIYNQKKALECASGSRDVKMIDCTIYDITSVSPTDYGSGTNLCENTGIGTGKTYRFDHGYGTVRNTPENYYKVRSVEGATVTVEYTDGRTFSVDGAGKYTSYVITSGTHAIKVIGEESTGTVSGCVTDTSSAPIPGATVSVAGTGRSDETDSSGFYSVTGVPVGTYTVTASASGYEDASALSVKVNKDEIKTINFQLTAKPSDDTTSPAAVTDLATSNPSSNSVTLTWTAPGDDEDTGTATEYDIRYFTSEITEANWDSAIQCRDELAPQEAGNTETFTVTGLSPDTTYYFALKTADEIPNWSDISNSASGTTTEAVVELAGYWELDEGSGNTAQDSSGNNNDGTIHGASWTEGKLGKALSFDGTDDYVDCGQDTSLKITGAITVEAWVKWLGAGNPYFVTKMGGTNRWSYDLSGNRDGTVEFRVGGADCNSPRSSGTIPIPTGEWVYLVGTYEPSSNVRLFVNGALAKECTTAIPAAQGENGLHWYIGAREGNQGYFDGVIDEVKIHNGALSAEEIRENYEENPTNNPPTAIIDSITPDIAEQEKETVSFTGHGTDTDGTVVAYNWRSDVDGQLSTASSFNKPASELSVGTHTIYFKVQDDKGAWSTEVMEELTINPEPENSPPVADPKGPYTGTEGVPITFDGSTSSDSDGSILAYEWGLGDGSSATGEVPTHTYAQEGTYTVTLKVTDNEGAINTSTTTATIADTEPTADFSASPTSGRRRLLVDFTDNSASYDGIETWEWDFDNDGEIDSTEQNPTHVYTKGGVYTVSLTVYESDGGSETMTKEDYIEVIKMKLKVKRNP